MATNGTISFELSSNFREALAGMQRALVDLGRSFETVAVAGQRAALVFEGILGPALREHYLGDDDEDVESESSNDVQTTSSGRTRRDTYVRRDLKKRDEHSWLSRERLIGDSQLIRSSCRTNTRIEKKGFCTQDTSGLSIRQIRKQSIPFRRLHRRNEGEE